MEGESATTVVVRGVQHPTFAWNEFAFALVFISRDQLKTLPVGLLDMQSRLLTDWPVQLAGLTIAAVPKIVLSSSDSGGSSAA